MSCIVLRRVFSRRNLLSRIVPTVFRREVTDRLRCSRSTPSNVAIAGSYDALTLSRRSRSSTPNRSIWFRDRGRGTVPHYRTDRNPGPSESSRQVRCGTMFLSHSYSGRKDRVKVLNSRGILRSSHIALKGYLCPVKA